MRYPSKMAALPNQKEDQSTTRGFQRVIRRKDDFPRKINISKCPNENGYFHKCGKIGGFINDYPLTWIYYKEYIKYNP